MRVIIVGGGALGRNLAEILIKKAYEVIIIERGAGRAEELAETLDCTVIQAEGTRPDILEKAEISNADAIVACTSHDQDNILIGLIARNYGVSEIIIRTDDLEFHTVAKSLGFHHVVNPPQTTSAIISDALRGLDTIELSTLVRGDVRFTSHIATEKHEGIRLSDLDLPKKSAPIGLYRGAGFFLYTEDPAIKAGDEVLFVTVGESDVEISALFATDNTTDDESAAP